MRRPDTRRLSQQERTDLDALDRALAGERLDGSFAGIEHVLVALADDAPRLHPAAAELLRRRVDGRLAQRRLLHRRGPRPARAVARAGAATGTGAGAAAGGAGLAPRRGGRGLQWLSRPAFAAAATVLIVAVAGTWVAIDNSSGPPSHGAAQNRTPFAAAATANGAVATTTAPGTTTTVSSESATASGTTTTVSGEATTSPGTTTAAVVPGTTYGSDAGAQAGGLAPPTAGAAAGARSAGPLATLVPAAPTEDFSSSAPGTARQVQHDVDLSLSVPHGQVQAAANSIVQVAERFDGFVASSYVSTGSQVTAQASFTLSLPSDRLSQELAALVHVGNVISLSQNSLDITGQVNGAADALAQDRAQRSSLLRQLAAATTADDVTALTAQLRRIARRIARDETAVSGLHRRATYASLSVTLIAAPAPKHKAHKAVAAHWTAGGELRHALNLLERTVTAIAVGFAVAGPILIVLALFWWAAALARRRRREQALRAA